MGISVKKNEGGKGSCLRYEQMINLPGAGKVSLVRAASGLKSKAKKHSQLKSNMWGDHNQGYAGWHKLLYKSVKLEKR